jgi:hypothetical protein
LRADVIVSYLGKLFYGIIDEVYEGWHRASASYSDFIRRHENLHVLYLELGVGANTPVIIKYPFWQMTLSNENAVYACLNYGEAFCPGELEDRSICIDGDIGEVFDMQIF